MEQNNPAYKPDGPVGEIPANRCVHCRRDLAGTGALICTGCEDRLINNSIPIAQHVAGTDWDKALEPGTHNEYTAS